MAKIIEKPRTQSLANKEQTTSRYFYPILALATLSGFINHFLPGFGIWQQWYSLFHSVVGIALSIACVFFVGYHFRRTLGFRRPWVLISGIALTLVLIGLALSGVQIIVEGSTQSTAWIRAVHIQLAYIIVGFSGLHLVTHYFGFPQKRRKAGQGRFLGLNSVGTKVILLTSIIWLLPTIAWLSFSETEYSSKPVIDNYQYSYGQHPFRPSQTETYHQKFIDPREIAISDDCAECHQDIAMEWRASVHKQAASDPTYVTNVSLLANNKGIAATRYCEGCHAPIALLTGELTDGGKHGGIKNTQANHEGVGCLGCHGIDKVIHTKGVASYQFGPPSAYLFSGFPSEIAKHLRHFLIKTHPSLHKAEMAKPPLSKPELCATCHAQFMDKDMNNWGWVKMQDEYSAWLNSHFSQQTRQTFSKDSQVTCQNCHMPLVDLDDPSANNQGKVSSHRYLAANTLLPLLEQDDEHLEKTIEFLQSDKLRISIEPPHRSDATQTLRALDENIRQTTESPYHHYLGEDIDLKVVISNVGVGHNFPGGTIDINQAWVSLIATDSTGEIFYHSGFVDEDGYVDPKAHFYRSRPIDKNGDLVWKHDLFNRVGEAYKNIIPAGKSDVVEYTLTIPYWVKGPITVSAAVKYRKLNTQYAKWALKEKYTPIPIVDMARDTLLIPIRMRRESTE